MQETYLNMACSGARRTAARSSTHVSANASKESRRTKKDCVTSKETGKGDLQKRPAIHQENLQKSTHIYK